MNRQRMRMIALAALVVAAGAYVWAQRTASTVKPSLTANAAMKKPGAVKPSANKTALPPANAKSSASATAAVRTPASAPVTPAKSPAPAASNAPATAAKVPAALPPAPNVSATPAAAPGVTAPVVPAAVVPSAWQDQLQKGAYLAERLKPRLPEGADVAVAASGFRDLQQFVATVTASHNLKLNFDELKRRVVTDGKGLAHAIDAMKKVASATIEEQRAEYEARGLIQEAKRHPAPAPAAVKAVTKEQPKKPARAQSGI